MLVSFRPPGQDGAWTPSDNSHWPPPRGRLLL